MEIEKKDDNSFVIINEARCLEFLKQNGEIFVSYENADDYATITDRLMGTFHFDSNNRLYPFFNYLLGTDESVDFDSEIGFTGYDECESSNCFSIERREEDGIDLDFNIGALYDEDGIITDDVVISKGKPGYAELSNLFKNIMNYLDTNAKGAPKALSLIYGRN